MNITLDMINKNLASRNWGVEVRQIKKKYYVTSHKGRKFGEIEVESLNDISLIEWCDIVYQTLSDRYA